MAGGLLVLNQPSGPVSHSADMLGNAYYDTAVAAPRTFTVDKESVVRTDYVGDSVRAAGLTVTASAIATQQVDGYAGDLSRGQLKFVLAGALGGSGAASAPMNAGGQATATLTGLTPDVYDVTTLVPSDDRWWTGGGEHSELVVFDVKRKGVGSGTLGTTKPRQFSFDARYLNGTASGRASYTSLDGTFTGSSVHWFVASGNQAVVQVDGTFAGESAVLRAVVVDNGATGDTVSLVITTPTRTISEATTAFAIGGVDLT
jgi:hypothetical protein